MRQGNWAASEVQAVTGQVRLTASNTVIPAKVERTVGMYEGHPSYSAREPFTTVKVTIEPERSVTRLAAKTGTEPFEIGSEMMVEYGDGISMWSHGPFTVADRSGSLLSGNIVLDLVDSISKFEVEVSRPALLAQMHPTSGAGDPWRMMGLTTTFIIDWVLRQAGYYTTPPPQWETVFQAPMMGSLWPLRGTLIRAHRTGNVNLQPSWFQQSEIGSQRRPGLMLANADAEYVMSGNAAEPEITIEIGSGVLQSGRFYLHAMDGATGHAAIIAYNATTNQVGYGVSGPDGSARDVAWVDRGTALRAVVRMKRDTMSQQTVRLRLSDRDTEYVRTTSKTTFPIGWEATRCMIYNHEPGDAVPLGAIHIANAPYPYVNIDWEPNAIVRQKEVNWLTYARDIDRRPLIDLLREMTDAMCGAFWLDEVGRVHVYDRGVLGTKPIDFTVDTLNHVNDWTWHDDRDSSAKRVYLTYRTAWWQQRTWQGIGVWDSDGPTGFVNGDQWTTIVNVPSEEDWIGVDTNVAQLGPSDNRWTVRRGTTLGITQVDTEDGDFYGETWAQFNWNVSLQTLGIRAWKWTVNFTNVAPQNELNLQLPEANNIPPWWRGRDQPVMRAFARIRSFEETDASATMTGASAAKERYVHDCDWYVQDSQQRNYLRTFLAQELSDKYPIIDDVKIQPDPRVQIGDMGRFNDPSLSGSSFRGIVIGISDSWMDGEASMSLKVRPIGFYPQTDPDDTEPESWLQQQSQWAYPD